MSTLQEEEVAAVNDKLQKVVLVVVEEEGFVDGDKLNEDRR